MLDDIRTLPARQRAAILLASDGEKSNIEIADALGVSLGAAEQLLVRARRTLRARLAGTCRVRSATPITVRLDGRPVPTRDLGDGVIEFEATAGATYRLAPRS